MRRLRLVSVVGLLALVAAIPAVALSLTHYEGKVGKRATLGIEARRTAGGKVVKIESLGWDGLRCGTDSFTGGSSKPITVRNHAFHSTQPVGGVTVPLTLIVRGHFANGDRRASGILKITGACTTGKKSWSARIEHVGGR